MNVVALNHDPITNTFSVLFRDQKANEIQVRGSLTVPGIMTSDEIKKRALAEAKTILSVGAAGL
jgi:hypothetical protein